MKLKVYLKEKYKGKGAWGTSETESCLWKFISFIRGQFSRYLSSLRPVAFVSHIPVICLRTHRVCTHTLAKMDLEVKASGRSKAHHGLELSSDFWLQRAFPHMCSVLPNPLLTQGFASLCPCQDYSLEVFTRDKDWLLTLFLLLLQFLRANRGLVVNSSTVTHLSVAPGNAEWRLAVNFQPGAHLSPISLVPWTVIPWWLR